MKNKPIRDEASSLRPVGVMFAAVVAGLGSGQAGRAAQTRAQAPLEPAAQAKLYFVDPTNHPGFEEDASLVFGASTAVAVLGEVAREEAQAEMFEL